MAQNPAQTLLGTDEGVGDWVLDGSASSVGIAHRTMWGLVTVRGSFAEVDGQGGIGPGGAVSGTLTVKAASVDTKNKKRDDHLRSADFFDVAQHPEITVRITSADPADDTVRLTGELTVRGVTRPLDLTATVTEATAGSVTVSAETAVDRADFGITWNQVGMLKGLTTATVTAVFTRPTA